MDIINISFDTRNQFLQIPMLKDEGKAFIIGIKMALNKDNLLLTKEQINICINNSYYYNMGIVYIEEENGNFKDFEKYF